MGHGGGIRRVSESLVAGWGWRPWLLGAGIIVTVLVVAVGVMGESTRAGGVVREAAVQAMSVLGGLSIVDVRAAEPGYARAAFGSSWTDAVAVAGGGNGCDTRNDVLARDLRDTRVGATRQCPQAVLSGELVSPYTGEFIVFDRDRGAADIQIDHLIPLAYAWDMGAAHWSSIARTNFANDPANLVAVDAGSNQAKSDSEPGRWMPPERGFWCQYAIQFTAVAAGYGLAIDAPSRDVLKEVLAQC